MVKVLLADNHSLVRGCILRLLGDNPEIKVLGDASDFSEAITKAHKLRPDVLILDLHMPLGPGLSSSNLTVNSTRAERRFWEFRSRMTGMHNPSRGV